MNQPHVEEVDPQLVQRVKKFLAQALPADDAPPPVDPDEDRLHFFQIHGRSFAAWLDRTAPKDAPDALRYEVVRIHVAEDGEIRLTSV